MVEINKKSKYPFLNNLNGINASVLKTTIKNLDFFYSEKLDFRNYIFIVFFILHN